MILVGIGFKLAIVPFYLWTPDVYQGSPAPVAALIATISKGSVFVFFMRFFLSTNQPSVPIVLGIAIASMLIGNLLALFQDNIKRLLAYSSIAHIGYVSRPSCLRPSCQTGRFLYLTAYGLSILGVFCVITMLSSHGEDQESLSSFHGLAWRHPALAAAFTFMFFSLAGLPLTAGFIGKVYILRAAISSDLWLPVAVLIAASVIGLFYYLRVIFSLFVRGETGEKARVASISGSLALALLVLALLWIGIDPNGFLEAVSGLL